jgi:cobalt-zinc-cadmium efflux system protein
MVLNTGFIIAEVAFGLRANSLALLADAGHNLSDVLGLFVAWGATLLARRQPSSRHTYGLRGASIVAALANAGFLLVAIGGVGWEAIQRLFEPEASTGITVMVVAGFGIAVNGVTALLFMSGTRDDINIRGAFLHMASDAAVSAGVVIAGGVILFTGWAWLDPVVSLAIAAVILIGTWGLLRDALHLSLQGVPAGVDIAAVRGFLKGRAGVTEVHDLHIWGMSTTETALTAHLVMPSGHPGDAFLQTVAETLEHDYKIHHATLQIELGDTARTCGLQPDTTV